MRTAPVTPAPSGAEQLLLARRRAIDMLSQALERKQTPRARKKFRRQKRRLVEAGQADANKPRESNALVGRRANDRRRMERDAVIRGRREERAKERGEVAKFDRGELKPVFEMERSST